MVKGSIPFSPISKKIIIYSIVTNHDIMMSVTKRRRGSVAHSRLYWRTMGDHVCGGVQFMYCPCRSVWCKQFLQRHGIEYE